MNQEGVRTYDRNINRLTVVANESYNDFAKALQNELQEDCGVDFSGRIKPKRERVAVKYRKGFETDPLFFAIWDRIKAKTTYKVNYDTAELIKDAASAVKRMPPVKAPSIRSTKTTMLLNDSGVQAEYKGDKLKILKSDYVIPDVVIGNEKYIIFGKMEYIRISNNDASFSVTMVHRFR